VLDKFIYSRHWFIQHLFYAGWYSVVWPTLSSLTCHLGSHTSRITYHVTRVNASPQPKPSRQAVDLPTRKDGRLSGIPRW